jgi:hypothetical protein
MKSLGNKLDGRELMAKKVDPVSHLWVRYPQKVFPRLYVRGLQLRAGVLGTKVRRLRGRVGLPTVDVKCRGGCGQPESLSHILQKCQVTHDGRCARHNRVVYLTAKKLGAGVDEAWVEPIIPVPGSYRKPDLVIRKDETLYVMDLP